MELLAKRKHTEIQQTSILITLFLTSCIIFSCNFFTKKDNITASDSKEKVTKYHYQLWWLSNDSIRKDMRDSIVTHMDTMNLFNRINQVFALNDSVYTEAFIIENDSFFLHNVYCPNLDSIHLRYKDEKIKLIVSHYDVENSCDEEMYVYWNHDYGLVALYNYPWGVLFLFDRETKKGFAKEIFYDDFINRKKKDDGLF